MNEQICIRSELSYKQANFIASDVPRVVAGDSLKIILLEVYSLAKKSKIKVVATKITSPNFKIFKTANLDSLVKNNSILNKLQNKSRISSTISILKQKLT